MTECAVEIAYIGDFKINFFIHIQVSFQVVPTMGNGIMIF